MFVGSQAFKESEMKELKRSLLKYVIKGLKEQGLYDGINGIKVRLPPHYMYLTQAVDGMADLFAYIGGEPIIASLDPDTQLFKLAVGATISYILMLAWLRDNDVIDLGALRRKEYIQAFGIAYLSFYRFVNKHGINDPIEVAEKFSHTTPFFTIKEDIISSAVPRWKNIEMVRKQFFKGTELAWMDRKNPSMFRLSFIEV